MIGGSSFLKGNFLEIGIAPNGSLGGGPPVPAGYHPSASLNSIGARFDGGRDGWTVGTPPAYGEFTMLGGLFFEGWAVQANGVRYDAFYTTGPGGAGTDFSTGLTGSNVSWSNTGSTMTNVWQGSVAGLAVRQTSSIFGSDSWMTTTVSIRNTTASAITGVYFWRCADSDGDPATPIDYNTVNRIVYQNDIKNRSLVVAEGVTYRDARMGYGAVDPRAKVMIYELWAPTPANIPGNSLDKVYNQTATGLGFKTYNAGGTTPAAQDIAIGIIFNLGTIAAGDSAVFRYITTFGDTTTVDSIVGTSKICVGESISFSSNVFPGGAWASTNTAVATVSNTGLVTGLSPGSTSIHYGGPPPGPPSVNYYVLVEAPPLPINGMSTVCAGFTSTLTSTPAGGMWTSSNTSVATIAQTGILSGLNSGVTIISYSNSCGMATHTVAVTESPGAITGGNAVCIGITLALSNSTHGGTWSSTATGIATVNAATGVVTGVAAGNAALTYATACGVATTTVTVGAAGYIDAGAATVCAGNTVVLSNAMPGGTWSTINTNLASVTAGGALTGISAGLTTVTYTLSTCALYITTVTVLPAPNVGVITGAAMVCVGSTSWLSDTVAGGVWSSSNTLRATVGNDGSVTGVSTGAVTISYTITGACGTASATKVIAINDIIDPGVIVGPGRVCEGAAIALSNAVSFGSWSSANTAASVSATGIVTGLNAGVAVISYSIISNSCGVTVATASVTVDPAPGAGVISGLDSVCPGAVIQLNETVAGGAWSSSNVAVASILNTAAGRVHALAYGVARISYTVGGAAGCSGVATFTLAVTPPPFTINAVVTNVACNGDKNGSIAASISGSAPLYHFLWSTGATTSLVSGLDSGFYILNVNEPQAQCIADTAFTITQPASIAVSDSTVADLCNGGTGAVLLHVTGGAQGYSYLWSTQETGRDIRNLHAGVYSVVVTDMNNCTRQHTATVADSACKDVIIHDVITPNGDGYNDLWIIDGIKGYTQNSVQVFDKWGDKIFDKSNYQNDWGGMGKNGLLPDGTYYYLVRLNTANAGSSATTYNGSLLIKR